MKRIYLDYASLTPIDKGVMKQIQKYSIGDYSNPSGIHTSAINARRLIDDAKIRIAKIIHAHADEILFTSGGTEANHLILNKFKDEQILISEIEHSSIISNEIGNKNIIKIPVNNEGLIDLEILKKSITTETKLVSIMMVNNEIGTIEQIQDIAKIVRDARKGLDGQFPLLHTDACQAMIHLPIYVEKLGVDLISLDGAKIYGPRGIGMLYIKRGVLDIERAGTENTASIAGFAYAIELAEKMREKETTRMIELKNYFVDELIKLNLQDKEKAIIKNNLEGIKINSSLKNSCPHILNVSIPNIDNEFFLFQLDAKGIEVSTKSSCLRDEDESYVLKAIGANSKNSIRFSFGRDTKKSDLKKVIKIIKQILIKNN